MEGIEAMADFSCGNNLVQSSIKQEEDSECALSVEKNSSGILDDKIVKLEPQDWCQVDKCDSVRYINSETLDEKCSNFKNTEIKTKPQYKFRMEINNFEVRDLKTDTITSQHQDVCQKEPLYELKNEIRDFEIYDIKNVLVKPEHQDMSHTEMRQYEYGYAMNIKLEAGDPEAAGRGVDGGLRGRLKEETSPHPYGNLNTLPIFTLKIG